MDTMKVTECWTIFNYDNSPNSSVVITRDPKSWHVPAVLLWKSDYEALLSSIEQKCIDAFESGYMDGRINELSLHEAKKRFQKEGK